MLTSFSRALLDTQCLPPGNIQHAEPGFSVYRNNVFSSLITALEEIFPVCCALMGKEAFVAVSQAYIRQHPPTSPVLSEYGHLFGDFLQHCSELRDYPYLTEVATLEYRLLQLTYQAETNALTVMQLQQHLAQHPDPTQTLWRFVEPCRLWHSQFAIATLYDIHQRDAKEELTHLDWQQEEYLLLTKQGLYGHCYRLHPDEWQMLSALQQGQTLAQACDALDVADSGLPLLLSEMMQRPIFTTIDAGGE